MVFIVEVKLIAFEKYFHRDDNQNSIWNLYYEGISPPSEVITGEVEKVTATDKKCFAYICRFIGLQDRAVKFEDTNNYSILLIENIFSEGSGTIFISSSSNTAIIIDKFCSFESQTSSSGQFTYFKGKINSTILQGSICNGGNSSEYHMICQYQGFGSLSKTNISNCISLICPSFLYDEVESIGNVAFCNFENLIATQWVIAGFSNCLGIIERCNYINNSQEDSSGIVYAVNSVLDIFDSSFQNNRLNGRGALFYGDSGQINIHRCSIDDTLFYGDVDTADQGTKSFMNNLKFIDLSPCEGNLEIVLLFVTKKENKICSPFKSINFLFGKFFMSILFF